MTVQDFEEASWFLLAADNGLFIDVNCSHGAFGYSVLIELNESEREQYNLFGHSYLDELAEFIRFSAPGIRGSDSPYKDRNASPQIFEAASSAIKSWRSKQDGKSGVI